MTLLVPSEADAQPAPQIGPPNVLTDSGDPIENWFTRNIQQNIDTDRSVPTRIGRTALTLADQTYTGLRDYFNVIPDVAAGKYSPEQLEHLASQFGVQTAMMGMGAGAFSPAEADALGMFNTWHGTPNRFAPTEANPLGEFDVEKMGSGEGAQVRGLGFYSAERQGVGKSYMGAGRDVLPLTVSLDDEPIISGGTGHGTAFHNGFFDLEPGAQSGMDALAGDIYEGLQSIPETAKNLRAKATTRLNSIPDWPDYEDQLRTDAQNYNAGADWLENNQHRLQFRDNPRGHLLDVLVKPDKHEFLDLDAPITEQDIGVQEKLEKLGFSGPSQEALDHIKNYNEMEGMINDLHNGRFYQSFDYMNRKAEQDPENLWYTPDESVEPFTVKKDTGVVTDQRYRAHPDTIAAVKEMWPSLKESGDWIADNPEEANDAMSPMTGDEIYWQLAQNRGPRGASEFLARNGIPGSKFWDQGSRAAQEGTRNYITFDPKNYWVMGRDGRRFFPEDFNPWDYEPPPERPAGSEITVHRVGTEDGIFYGTHIKPYEGSVFTTKKLPLYGDDVQTIHGTDNYGDADNAPVADAVDEKLIPLDHDLHTRLEKGINDNNADITWGTDLAGMLQLKRNGINVAHFPSFRNSRHVVSVDLRHVDIEELERRFAEDMGETK